MNGAARLPLSRIVVVVLLVGAIWPSHGIAGSVRLTPKSKLPYKAPLQLEFMETGPMGPNERALRLGFWATNAEHDITIEQIARGPKGKKTVVDACVLRVSDIRKKLGLATPSSSLALLTWRAWNWVELSTNGRPIRIFYTSCKAIEVSGGR